MCSILIGSDLMSLEDYTQIREAFRAKVLKHKKPRRIVIGEHAMLYFEDRLTIRYQIQEMLRIERLFERTDIEQELAVYNPLIPDGSNLKATFMLEYPDSAQRRQCLVELKGIEHTVWMQIAGQLPVVAIADEDMDRENEDKTSAVHFMRFEFAPAAVTAFATGAAQVHVGIDHSHYHHRTALNDAQHAALAADFS